MIKKEKVLELLHSLGGCDASSEYAKGWDDAINAAYDEVAKMKNSNPRKPRSTKVERLPDDDPNLIMVRRVIRACDTKDPIKIGEIIMNNPNIRAQTTFTSVANVMGFIDRYHEQVFEVKKG